MQREAHIRLLAGGNNRLQKIGNVLPQFLVGVSSFFGQVGRFSTLLMLNPVNPAPPRPSSA